jgi:hypothetical protein
MNLTGIPALDVAIGLSFIYLVLSLLASAVQEWIASLLALRSRTLEKGLASMLAENDKLLDGTSVPNPVAEGAPAADLLHDFYAHPLIRSLYNTSGRVLFKPKSRQWENGRLPSYISPHAFGVALSDILGAHGTVDNLEERIGELPILDGVKYRLLTLARQSENDVVSFRAHLEKWFDDTMARVSGWYKRQTQWILLVLALVVTLALNANSLTMGQQLYKDPTVRAAVVAQATSSTVTGQTSGPTPAARLNDAADSAEAVKALGVPLGWPDKASDPAHVDFDNLRDWLTNVLGWVLTIAALSMGAPFWFDTLSRLSRLRSSGKPETPLPAPAHGAAAERVPAPPKATPAHPPDTVTHQPAAGPPPT